MTDSTEKLRHSQSTPGLASDALDESDLPRVTVASDRAVADGARFLGAEAATQTIRGGQAAARGHAGHYMSRMPHGQVNTGRRGFRRPLRRLQH